ncbi:hypothetical protein R6Q59_006888 [Mikania micrantha]
MDLLYSSCFGVFVVVRYNFVQVDVFGSWIWFDSAETHCHQSFFGPWVFCAVWLFGCCSTWLFSRLFRGWFHLTWKGKDCSQGGVWYGWRLLIAIELIGWSGVW